MNSILTLITIIFISKVSVLTAVDPGWHKIDPFGRYEGEYTLGNYSTEEPLGAKYNPNLPEEERSKYVGKVRTEEVLTTVCNKRPDSGYYCLGSIGDIPTHSQRYYYDFWTKSCRCMLYNGCDGNANNFRGYNDCLQWCSTNVSIAHRITSQPISTYSQLEAICLYFY